MSEKIKGFPNRFLGFTIGWKDRGEVGSRGTRLKNGEIIYDRSICTFCRSVLNVGREQGEPFLYCPKCLVKIKKEPNAG